MRKLLSALTILFISTVAINAGAPPTVMFLPDKTWCNTNGFIKTSERNGKTRYSEMYDEAFMQNPELKNVVVQLNGLMKDNGLPTKDYGAQSEIDDEEENEEALYEGESDGAEMEMTPYEAAMNKLRPDIIIKVGWEVNKVGFNYTLTYRLEAVDSYSGKSVAQVTADTPTTKISVPVSSALKAAATEHMSQFIARMQEHFDDLQANGREITLACRLSPNGGSNFNTEFGGKALGIIISEWLDDNTVNHAYSTRSSTRNRLQFEQVRIPFRNAQGRTMAAKEFAEQLRNHLKTLGLAGENTTKGIGAARIYDIH